MKRTTIFIDEQIERELQGLARRKQWPVAAVVREAIQAYVVSETRQPLPVPGFVGTGRSGRTDIAERHEELLWKDPHDGSQPPSVKPTRPRRPRRAYAKTHSS